MTRKDFELIAGVLRYCEAHCDNDEESGLVEWVAEKFEDALASEYPRFNRGTFQAASTPIKVARVKATILKQLGQS